MSVMGPETKGRGVDAHGRMMGFGPDTPFNTRAEHATEMPAARHHSSTPPDLSKTTVGDVDGVR